VTIGALPYTNAQTSIFEATTTGDPTVCGRNHIVWYRWTNASTAAVYVQADTIGSLYDTRLGLYTGLPTSSTAATLCDDDSGGGNPSRVRFYAAAGTTYYFAIGSYNLLSADSTLRFNLTTSATPTRTLTPTLTATRTPSLTPSSTRTASLTPSRTNTGIPGSTATPTPTPVAHPDHDA
jgi:hypothetical protein